MTSITNRLRELNTPEPQKTFIKMGVTEENGDLTSEGRDLVLQFLFEQNQDEILKEIQPLVDADAKKSSE